MSVDIRIKAVNAFKKGIDGALAGIQKLGSVVKAVGRQMRRMALAAGVGFIFMVREANKFRVQMAEVGTMLGENRGMLGDMGEELLKMSAKYGMATTTLSKGLYDILSAGVPAAKAMDVLRVATEAAIGGVTDTATSVDALTTVLNAYSLGAEHAEHVSDVLFQVVKDGKVTYTELAENIGKLAPLAHVAGVSLEELGAALATTLKVEKPERAMTAINAALITAAKKGKTLFQIAKEFQGKGLKDILKGGFDKRAAVGVALLASNFGLLQEELGRFANVSGVAGGAFKQLEEVRHWPRLWQSFLGVVKAVGVEFDKVLGPIADRVAKKIQEIGATKFYKGWAEAIGGVLEDIETIFTTIAGGGEKGKAAWEGLKRWGGDMAKEAGAVLLSYAPIIGAAIGTAAKTAFTGGRVAMGRRAEAARQLAAERGERPGEWEGLGILGMGPQSAEISRRAAQAKGQALREQGQALAAKFAGGTGTTLHGLAMDLTDNTITKLGKATADSMKEER